jgi:glycine hydroxymethyltransferase
MGRDFEKNIKADGKEIPLWKRIEDATFPGMQGTPYLNHIAAKAVFFREATGEEYKERQFNIIKNAKRLASNMAEMGYDVLTGGTDNHMILVNVSRFREGLSGLVAQKCLEDCGIVVDFHRLPYDLKPAFISSGIRLGTPIVTIRGMGEKEMDEISAMVDKVLKGVNILGERQYRIDKKLRDEIRGNVEGLCAGFSIYSRNIT